jgi:hypothetical protein
MDLPDGEPECRPWRATSPDELHDLIAATPEPATGPLIVAIDGRGGSGKTVLARELAATAGRRGTSAAIVHTDDVAWYQSFFGWDGLLAEHVLAPVRAGRGADYRPQSWQDRGRPGAITVPAGAGLLLVEGSGSTRASLAPWLDATIWVQVDADLAEQRLRARDGDAPAQRQLIADWLLEEEPFMLREQPWARCRWVVSSTGDGDWRLGRPAPLR